MSARAVLPESKFFVSWLILDNYSIKTHDWLNVMRKNASYSCKSRRISAVSKARHRMLLINSPGGEGRDIARSIGRSVHVRAKILVSRARGIAFGSLVAWAAAVGSSKAVGHSQAL